MGNGEKSHKNPFSLKEVKLPIIILKFKMKLYNKSSAILEVTSLSIICLTFKRKNTYRNILIRRE